MSKQREVDNLIGFGAMNVMFWGLLLMFAMFGLLACVMTCAIAIAAFIFGGLAVERAYEKGEW